MVIPLEKAKTRYTEASDQIQERNIKWRMVESFLATTLKKKESLIDFDEQFWYATVETVTVRGDGKVVFRFKDGTEIKGVDEYEPMAMACSTSGRAVFCTVWVGLSLYA